MRAMYWTAKGATCAGALFFLSASPAEAQLSWSLAGGSENWPAWAKDAVTQSMNEAVALYNQHGFFEKHLTANYNAGVPTAQGNVDGWIDFGGSHNTRVALHEIAHTLGTGYYWATGGGAVNPDSAAGRLVKLYEGQGAGLSTGGTHFWPYGLNFDNEDGPAARERHCKLVAAFRFDTNTVRDSDADGLPDDWERHHFQHLDADGAGDADADGIRNADEYSSDADPNLPAPVRDGATYLIRSQRTQLLLSAVDASLGEGTRLALHAADGSARQQWTAHYAGQGFFRFTPGESERVLQTPGTDTASGRPLELATANGARQQEWRVVSGAGAQPDHFQIANRETARVVDGLEANEGAAVQQYPFLGNIAQQFWRFERVGGDTGAGDAGADAGRNSVDGGLPRDAGGGASPDGAVLADAAVFADAASAPDAQVFGFDAGEPDEQTRDGGCSLGGGAHGAGAAPWGLFAALGVLLARRRSRNTR